MAGREIAAASRGWRVMVSVSKAAASTPKPARRLEPANDVGMVISPGADLVGDLVVPLDVDVLGRVDGSVRARRIVVGEGAHVAGTLIAHEVEIFGTLKDGAVIATRVHLRGGCDVEGDLYYSDLNVDEGALFEGKSRRHDDPFKLVDGAG